MPMNVWTYVEMTVRSQGCRAPMKNLIAGGLPANASDGNQAVFAPLRLR
ncbi:hypothetical protein PG2022B_1550 [Bifidobacterium animalis subsp. animalis]|nr:hypothetical protein PG2022B_1550 [Bifidobacterium animalis subsp. animalis]